MRGRGVLARERFFEDCLKTLCLVACCVEVEHQDLRSGHDTSKSVRERR